MDTTFLYSRSVSSLKALWCLVVQSLMGANLIVKPNILLRAPAEMLLRSVVPAVGLLLFERGEKGLGYGVIQWAATS